MTTLNNFFLDTIYHLRNHEEILLHTSYTPPLEEDKELLTHFLEMEYGNECLEYPGTAPVFDGAAALWGAQVVYTASLLLLDRKHHVEEIPTLLPSYTGPVTEGAMLSADLCLRFLPQIIKQLQAIDAEDVLIPLLEQVLTRWHYSGIGLELGIENELLEIALRHNCLRQLYVNRIIQYQYKPLATHPLWQPWVMAAMGNYTTYFWKDL
ncbi:hypothetical protein SAMN05421788_103336 [Filimonas lacunae]|uniref:MoxR-vWA-beta-propeller ternary system domain-containing protein n=1 Tax=Filimonas lacunae TaxID=477680 RepID=A0A173MK28_9BACT|nr:hypothetical protein [Filimonas lacunae]BAV07993.1 hypothetical protein FLA_4026 [Filimonas lacunae]SIT07621.1 hypothetical protein SAMN05421788_103336 [Filimonas lacunae]